MSRTQGKPMNIGAPPAGMSAAPGDPMGEAMGQLAGGRGMVQTKTQYQTAITVVAPRDLDKLRAAVIKEATYSRDSFFYAWTQEDRRAGKPSLIEGVSIDGAMILVRNWGNAVCEPDLVDESPAHWLIRATFIDLETGFTSGRLFRQRKNQKVGRHDDERALDIQFQIGQSKAIRNSVIRCVPAWLVDEAMDAAKAGAAERYANVAKSADIAIKAYADKHGIVLDQLERKLGKKRADWIPADLVLLNAIYRAIVQGMTSVGQEFSADEPAPSEAEGEDAGETVPAGVDAARAEADAIAKGTGGPGYDVAAEPAKPATASAGPPVEPAEQVKPATPAAAESKPAPAAVESKPAEPAKPKEPEPPKEPPPPPADPFAPPTKGPKK